MFGLLKRKNLKASVVVGIHLGVTRSGFSYAHTMQPEDYTLFYEWPAQREAGGSHDCQTATSLLYSYVDGRGSSSQSEYVLQAWGYEALVQHAKGNGTAMANTSPLASAHLITGKTFAEDLPDGLTHRRTISDFLRKLSELIIRVIRDNFGNHITDGDIQWCIAVPTMFDGESRHAIKTCAQIAGLVKGPYCEYRDASAYPLIIVLEPEAASLYFQRKFNFSLNEGDKSLVVDTGWKTVNVTLHEKVGILWSYKVWDMTSLSGGLGGGTDVDEGFSKFLHEKIRCFAKFAATNPQSVLKLESWWEAIKSSLDGSMQREYELDLPATLAQAWEEDESNDSGQSNESMDSYNAIAFTMDDMLSIFDPVVNQIAKLIRDYLIHDLKAMMFVGGFFASPYLQKRIKAAFSKRFAPGTIMFPIEPSSVICCGAVAFGLGKI